MTYEKDSKNYTIHIIDTPAYLDTGLTNEAVCCEIQKAIDISATGPRAFLLCIPAISITKYYTDVLKHYKHYCKDISDLTFITLTRYDQLDTESQEKMKQEIKSENRKNSIEKKKQESDSLTVKALPTDIKNDIIILQNDSTNALINTIISSTEKGQNSMDIQELNTTQS